MGQARNWTDEEKAYLREAWGNISIPRICTALNRSENAISIMAKRLSLGPFLENGDYITLCSLITILYGTDRPHSYTWYRETFLRKGLKAS